MLRLFIIVSTILVAATALRLPTSGVAHRSALATMAAASSEEERCALIDLSTDDPVRLAKVLKKSWMEGGVKRGLTGTVLVPSENSVQIVASGTEDRLRSFAEWLEETSMLVSGVEIVEADACPTEAPLTDRFPLAPALESKASDTEWFELLQTATIDVSAAAGKTHSSDEGLA